MKNGYAPGMVRRMVAGTKHSDSIYNYLNCKDFLSRWVGKERQRLPRASLESLSKKLGFRSRGHLHNLMSGKRRLTLSQATRMLRSMSLTALEKRYFLALVELENSKDQMDRMRLLDEAIHVQKLGIARSSQKSPVVQKRREKYFVHWYYPVIRCLASHPRFEPDGKWISKKLFGEIPPKEASRALEELVEWGYVSRCESGEYRPSEVHVWLDDSKPDLARRAHLQKMILKSSEGLSIPREKRAYASMMLLCPESRMSRAQELLNKFVSEFESEVESVSNESEVYLLNIGFHPLTRG